MPISSVAFDPCLNDMLKRHPAECLATVRSDGKRPSSDVSSERSAICVRGGSFHGLWQLSPEIKKSASNGYVGQTTSSERHAYIATTCSE